MARNGKEKREPKKEPRQLPEPVQDRPCHGGGRRAERPIAILVAPYLTQTVEEWRRIQALKLRLAKVGYIPIYLPDTLEGGLCDRVPEEREIALRCSASFVRQAAALPSAVIVRLSGRKTPGMLADVQAWPDPNRIFSEAEVWGFAEEAQA